MRHDAKLGLALGMLVLGFAVAFCFPRTPPAAPHNGDVASRDSVAVLQVLPIRAEPSNAEASSEPRVGDVAPTASATVEKPDLEAEFEAAGPPPPPLKSEIPETTAATTVVATVPELATTGSVTADQQRQLVQLQRAVEARQATTHQVRSGDTLTSIALQHLGSSQKYLSIYEANRDLLSSPDSLRVGMQLRIPSEYSTGSPAAVMAAEASPSTDSTADDYNHESGEQETAETSNGPADPKGRFQRAAALPFLSEVPRGLPLNALFARMPEEHIVRRGETLEQIAVRYYGDRRAVALLQALNAQQGIDPRKLLPGTRLTLKPELLIESDSEN